MAVASRATSDPIPSGLAAYRLAEFDGLRGIAALVVVVHNCLLTQPTFSDYFFSNWATYAQTPFQQRFFGTPARMASAGYEAVLDRLVTKLSAGFVRRLARRGGADHATSAALRRGAVPAIS